MVVMKKRHRQKSEFEINIAIALQTGAKLKRVMMNRHLTRARCKCTKPGCDGVLHAVLYPPRYHLHFRCDKCTLMLIE